MEEIKQKIELISNEKAKSLSRSINSAADAITIFSLIGLALYLYNFALIKVQSGEIGSYEKYEINWEAIILGLFLLLGAIGLNYILKGISGMIQVLNDIKMK